jgi:raffinose/stachyose/melibiose transport system substrate-binding protein
MTRVTLTRRRLLQYGGVAGLAALGGTSLAACGNASTAGGTGSIAEWLGFDDSAQQTYYQQHFVDAFNKNHKVSVSLSVKDQANIENNVTLALNAKRGPDLMYTGGIPHSLDYALAGDLAKLDPYVKKYNWDTKFQKWAINTATGKDGSVWGMPTSYNSVVLFYNPATFAKHNWKVPANRDEFEAICAEAKGKGMLPVACCSAAKPVATGWYLSGFLNSCAGPQAMYDALTGTAKWSDPVFVDAVTLMLSYFKKGWYGGGPASYATLTFNDIYAKLAGGQAAMMVMLSWAFETMPPFFGKAAGNDATYEFAALPPMSPHVPSDVYTLAIGSALSLNKRSKVADDAAAFIDYTLDPARQMGAVAAVAMPPAPINITGDQFPAKVDPQVKKFYLTLSTAQHVGYASWSAFPPNSHTYAYEGMNKVIAGSLSPQDFCAKLQSTFAPELKAGKVPPLSKPVA